NLLSLSFERAADELRHAALPEQLSLSLPSYVTRRDMRGAATILPVFHYVDAKLLLLATAWIEALSERPISGHQTEETFVPPGIPSHFPTYIPMLRMERASQPVKQLIRSIVDTHRAFGPASDYRSLACYPTFLAGAWQQILPFVRTPWYQERQHRLLAHAQTLVHTLPYPIPLSPERLRTILSGREVTSCHGILNMFQQMLPGLMLDVELMTRMLHGQQQGK
ncbi:MAG: hypothetical protein ACXVOI_04505, partial [Tumebacillaceae bacterium]